MIEKLQDLINAFNRFTPEQKEEALTAFRQMIDELQDAEVKAGFQEFLDILEEMF